MDLSPISCLRLLSGVFLIPHLLWDLRNPSEGAKIYKDAGIGFGFLLFPTSVIIETWIIISFLFDVVSRLTAVLAVLYFAIAAAVIWKLTRKWLWNFKGVEFLLFWSLCCVLIAIYGAGPVPWER